MLEEKNAVRPKLPAHDPYSDEAEEARAQRALDRAKGNLPDPAADVIARQRAARNAG